MGRIVIVNDEPNVLEVMMAVLEEDGHAVRGFAHGPEALAALEEGMTDLVITDCSNQPIDGVEFVRRLRGGSGCPRSVRLRLGARDRGRAARNAARSAKLRPTAILRRGAHDKSSLRIAVTTYRTALTIQACNYHRVRATV